MATLICWVRRRGFRVFSFVALATLGVSGSIHAKDGLRLSLPLDCDLGKACFVQNYVDIDPGPQARDFTCGASTYNGHKGVDIRVKSTAASAAFGVLAAADGTVLRGRDGMADRLLRDYASEDARRSVLAGKDCGNGIVVDHGEGWTTQYCHLKHRSLMVRPGQKVRRGERLGTVGYSGRADFAHVHMTVRYRGEVIDPFTGLSQNNACQKEAGLDGSLWSAEVARQMGYRSGSVFDSGFAGAVPNHDRMERNHVVEPVRADSPVMIFYARLLNLRKGDKLQLAVRGPAGFSVQNTTKPLAKNKAVYSIFAGKKRKADRWPAGHYSATIEVLRRPEGGRDFKTVVRHEAAVDLP